MRQNLASKIFEKFKILAMNLMGKQKIILKITKNLAESKNYLDYSILRVLLVHEMSWDRTATFSIIVW